MLCLKVLCPLKQDIFCKSQGGYQWGPPLFHGIVESHRLITEESIYFRIGKCFVPADGLTHARISSSPFPPFRRIKAFVPRRKTAPPPERGAGQQFPDSLRDAFPPAHPKILTTAPRPKPRSLDYPLSIPFLREICKKIDFPQPFPLGL